VVNVKTVAWSFHSPHARQRPIEAVAKPVDGQGQDNEPERTAIPARGRERRTRQCHSRQRQRRQMVGVDETRQPFGDEDEQPLLCRRKDAAVLPHMSHGLLLIRA
jgi:hypothetical protein